MSARAGRAAPGRRPGAARGRASPIRRSSAAAASRRRTRRRPVDRPAGTRRSLPRPAPGARSRGRRGACSRWCRSAGRPAAARRRRSSSRAAWRRNGRANARASRHRAAARSRSRSKWSRRLRRVSRGGEGERNMSELNGTSPRGVRRIRWNTIGAAMARNPSDVERREEAHRAPPRPGALSAARPPAPPHPRLQQVEQHQLQRPVGGDRLVFDAQVDARALDLGGVRGEPARGIRPAPRPGRRTARAPIRRRGTSPAS